MTTAERLRREGRAEGMAESMAVGKREMLLLQLRQRFGRLPSSAVGRIDKAGAAELDVWSSRVLTASSLDDVLREKLTAAPNQAVQPTRARPRGARQRTRV